jgi:hypothetical protein
MRAAVPPFHTRLPDVVLSLAGERERERKCSYRLQLHPSSEGGGQSTTLLESFQDSPARPSDKSSMK